MAAIERRIISVLFVDLVGFTALSERLDPEDVAAIQDEYFSRAQAAVVRHGGLVQKFIGDAVAATFGIPTVQDDDALRAVRAGWAIISAIEGVGASLGLEPGQLRVRAGVNTGRVVVAEHPADPAGWRITGDVVNVAARFQAAAEPGRAVVGADTALQVSREFDLEELTPLILKGKAEPVPAWRVTGKRIGRPPALVRTPFVGRTAELGQLSAAASGSGRPVQLVVAPPGLGKTRLLTEFERTLAGSGVACWRADAPTADAGPYAPVASLLRRALPIDDRTAARAHLQQLVAATGFDAIEASLIAEHGATIGWTEQLPGDDPDLVQRSLLICLEVLAPDRVVWLLEDLHEASPDLLALLGREADIGAAGRVIVAATRPALLDRVPFQTDRTAIVQLEPLGEDRVKDIVEALVGADVLEPAVLMKIAARAGGNPLFAEETVRSWILSGRLVEMDGSWTLPDGESLDPPGTMEAIYLGQLDDLPAGARHLAQVASIPGLTFPAGTLSDLGADPSSLDVLARWGLVEGPIPGTPDGAWYRYRHALLRDAAYGSMTRRERGRLHQAYARWLASLSGHDQRGPIAVHLEAAYRETPPLARTEEQATAAADALEAAAAGQLGAAPGQAADLYRRSIALTPGAGWEARIRRRLGEAEAERRGGHLEGAMTAFAAAGDEAAAAHRPETVAEAAVGYEDALFASRLPRAEHGAANQRLLDAALELLPDRPSGARAGVIGARARAAIYQEDAETGASLARSAAELARHAQDPAAEAYALFALRLAHAQPGQLAQRREHTEALIEAAASAGDHERELEGVRHLLIDHLQAGDVAAARSSARRAEELISELRRPLFFWYPAMWRAMFALLAGERRAGLRLVEAFHDEGRRWGYRDTQLVYAAQLAHLAAQTGNPALATEASDAAEATSGHRWWPISGLLANAAGDRSAAHHYFERMASDHWRVVPDDLSAAYVLALLIDLACELGEVDVADRMAERLSAWSGQAIVVGSGALCLGAVDGYLGRASLHTGNTERAAMLLERAVTLNRAMEARPALARSLRDLELATPDRADEPEKEAHALEEWCDAH